MKNTKIVMGKAVIYTTAIVGKRGGVKAIYSGVHELKDGEDFGTIQYKGSGRKWAEAMKEKKDNQKVVFYINKVYEAYDSEQLKEAERDAICDTMEKYGKKKCVNIYKTTRNNHPHMSKAAVLRELENQGYYEPAKEYKKLYSRVDGMGRRNNWAPISQLKKINSTARKWTALECLIYADLLNRKNIAPSMVNFGL